MKQPTVVDALFARSRELISFCQGANEISLALEAEQNLKKLLIMAAGSFFEEQIVGMLDSFASKHGEKLASFVRNKALKRQYHSFFNWDGNNANQFLGLFGDGFKNLVLEKLRGDPVLAACQTSFIRLGGRRNQLAHGNIAALPVDNTIDELEEEYRKAWKFACFLAAELGESCPADIALPDESLPTRS